MNKFLDSIEFEILTKDEWETNQIWGLSRRYSISKPIYCKIGNDAVTPSNVAGVLQSIKFFENRPYCTIEMFNTPSGQIVRELINYIRFVPIGVGCKGNSTYSIDYIEAVLI